MGFIPMAGRRATRSCGRPEVDRFKSNELNEALNGNSGNPVLKSAGAPTQHGVVLYQADFPREL